MGSPQSPDLNWLQPARLLDLVGEGIFLRDLVGNIRYWSAGAGELYGWSAAEALGATSHELLSTKFPEPRTSVERHCLERGTWTGELTQRCRDGRWIAISSRWELVHNDLGEPAGMLEVNRDITALKRDQARQKLRLAVSNLFATRPKWPQSAREYLRILTQSAGIHAAELWTFPRSGEPELSQLWTQEPPLPPSQIGPDLVRRSRDSAQFERAVDDGSAYLAMPVFVHQQVAWVVLVRQPSDEPTAIDEQMLPELALQLGRHIERAEALQALEQAEVRFRALLESAPDAMVIVDRQGLISLSNRRVKDILGYTSEDLIGHGVDELLPERLRATHGRHWRDYFKDPRARPMGVGLELFARRSDGAEIPVEISLSPIHLEGELLVAAAVRDMTVRRRLEAEARRLQNLELAEIEHRATLGEIAAGLAHEIKNPLAGISAALEVLLGSVAGPDREIMAEVQQQVGRIRGIVEDLLHYARPRPLQLERGDLNATIAQVIPMAVRNAQARSVTVTFEAGNLPPVEHDPDQIQRMLVNLIFNALDAVPAGTGRIGVATFARDGQALISVSDNGPGISAATLPKIFRPFFTTKGGKGSGLGLPLCQRIAELHAGSIHAASEEGRGANFTITLPTAAVQETALGR